MGMLAEREKRLLRAVTGGGQAIGAEPYPGKKGYQGYVLTRLVTEWIQRGTQQGCADRLHIRRPPHTLRRRARGEHTRSPPGVSDDFLTCKSGVVPSRSRRELRQAWGQLRLAGITIRTS